MRILQLLYLSPDSRQVPGKKKGDTHNNFLHQDLWVKHPTNHGSKMLKSKIAFGKLTAAQTIKGPEQPTVKNTTACFPKLSYMFKIIKIKNTMHMHIPCTGARHADISWKDTDCW